jgi:hypothetical protein
LPLASTLVALPATLKSCLSLPLFVNLKVTEPAFALVGLSVNENSLPLTLTVVAETRAVG